MSKRDSTTPWNRSSESKRLRSIDEHRVNLSRQRCYEFEITIPQKSLLRIQVWDWDLASSNDKIAETNIDIENRWFSSHRATCGLPKRYDRSVKSSLLPHPPTFLLDSAGYNAWRDTKKPVIILNELCRTLKMNVPIYTADYRSLAIGDVRFDCPNECLEFVQSGKASELSYRKVPHESTEEYVRQNTALVALHSWPRKINSVRPILVSAEKNLRCCS